MEQDQYITRIEATLRGLSDAEEAKAMQAYLLNQFEFLGIRAPVRRAAIKALPKQKWNSSKDLIEVAKLLWKKPEREFRYTTVDLLKDNVKLLGLSEIQELITMLQCDSWWETVDSMTSVINLVILKQVKTGDSKAQSVCDEWIQHPNFWVRRCAMLHQLGWRLKTDTDRLYFYSDLLSSENEFFIRKAIGWALRDYARWNPEWVRNVISQKQNEFSGLTIREASKHLK